jgi:hypothetical protein
MFIFWNIRRPAMLGGQYFMYNDTWRKSSYEKGEDNKEWIMKEKI